MKCPTCKAGTLAICKDVIVSFKIEKSKSAKGGEVLTMGHELHQNVLDRGWLECDECGATSNDDIKLEAIWDKVL